MICPKKTSTYIGLPKINEKGQIVASARENQQMGLDYFTRTRSQTHNSITECNNFMIQDIEGHSKIHLRRPFRCGIIFL